MTQDEIFEIAKQAGFMQHLGVICIPNIQNLERFAALVAKDEREACAKLAELAEPYQTADLIRKRGTSMTKDEVIAGVLFDFMGYLTSRKERIVLSSADDAALAVDAIRDFAAKRGLSLDDAQVRTRQEALAQLEEPAMQQKLDKAFNRYLNDCDKNAIVPDVAGAFHFAWQEALAQPVQPADLQERFAALHLYEEIAEHYAKTAISPEALRDWVAERMDTPPLPVQPVQDSCFCHDGASLQMVSGGAAPEGYLGKVTLLIDGEYVDYAKAQPVQEPVGYVYSEKGVKHGAIERDLPNGTPLYAAPLPVQPVQEPVAWLSTDSIGERYLCFSKPLDNDPAQPLYAHSPLPVQRPWVGLTDDEIWSLVSRIGTADSNVNPLMVLKDTRAIEQALKEKNNG
jgi:hypothetical protein